MTGFPNFVWSDSGSLRVATKEEVMSQKAKLEALKLESEQRRQAERARCYLRIEYVDHHGDPETWETDYPDNDALRTAWNEWTDLPDTARFVHFSGSEEVSLPVDAIKMVYPKWGESEAGE